MKTLVGVHPPVHRQVLSAGIQGPAGPMGPAGPSGGTSTEYVAGTVLGGHRIVFAEGTQVQYVDSADISQVERVVGITLHAAEEGAPVLVQRHSEITELTWQWEPGPVYLGSNGLLTQVVPSTGVFLQVGIALSATVLDLRISSPIILE